MIFGIGTDIIEVDRIKKKLLEDPGFKSKLFSDREMEYCEGKHDGSTNYAARYAAKEAFFKAIGTGWRNGLSFRDVEIINDDMGKPEIFLSGKCKELADKHNFFNIYVSLTHLKNIVNAIVIIEK